MERYLWCLLLFCIVINVVTSEKVKASNKLGPNVKKYLAHLEKALSSLKNEELMTEHRKFIEILNEKVEIGTKKKDVEEESNNDETENEDEDTTQQTTIRTASQVTKDVYQTFEVVSSQNPSPSSPNPSQMSQNIPQSSQTPQNQPESTKTTETTTRSAVTPIPIIITPPLYVANLAHRFKFATVTSRPTDEKMRTFAPQFVITPPKTLPPSVQAIFLPKIPNVIRSNELHMIGKFFPELGDQIDEDDMSYEYEEYEDEDENFVVQFKDDDKLTTPAICVEDSCPSFNCSSTDDKTFNAMKSIVPLSGDDVKEACGKSYLFSHVEQTYDKAGLSCCRENMNLLSVETPEEMKCLLQLYKDEITKGTTFWSSGRYLTCPHQYRWCGSWQRYTGGAMWRKNDKERGGECVSLKFTTDQISFVDDRCATKMKYICESETDAESKFKLTAKPPCSTATCPELECVVPPNPTLPSDIQIACGNKYYFSDKLSRYTRAAKECCAMGMKLVSIHTKEEQECLYKLFAGRIQKLRQVWTSGTDLGCESNYLWCGSEKKYNISAKLSWVSGEPNNLYKREHCLTLVHQDQALKLNDEFCEEHFPFICQA